MVPFSLADLALLAAEIEAHEKAIAAAGPYESAYEKTLRPRIDALKSLGQRIKDYIAGTPN